MNLRVWGRSRVIDVLLIAALAVAGPIPAFATETHQFDVPTEDAPTAIRDFASQAHVQILVAGENINDKHLHAISGEFSTEQGLRLLLADSGLSPRYVGDRSIALVKASDVNSPLQGDPKEGKKSSSQDFRVAQLAQGTTAQSSSLGSSAVVSHDINGGLTEIVVTAEKRPERLLDTPLAVTAVTSGDIEARGISALEDMQYAVPGLTIAQYGVGQQRLQLDGIASILGGTGLPVVSIYLDEMPLNVVGAYQPDVRLFDMERVEVLHGPQPTLYGDGAMGGTIHYITAAPDLKKFGGYVDGQWGSVKDGSDSYRGVAVLNAPLVDGVLGLRMMAGYERDGGWIRSLPTGQDDVNDHEFKVFRVKVLYRPLDALSVSFLYQHEEGSQEYSDFGMLNRTTAQFASPSTQTIDLGNLVASYDFGSATLLSTTGFFHNVDAINLDITGFFAPLLPIFYPPSLAATVDRAYIATPTDDHVFTEELRLSSNGGQPFNYTAGVYYRHYDANSAVSILTAPELNPPLDEAPSTKTFQDWAAFAELRYTFTDRLEALLGLRHFQERQSIETTSEGLLVVPGTESAEGTFVSNNPRLNISYKISTQGLVYANVAKGFRSGGFNLGLANAPPTYGPETLWTYTLGAKQQWLDHRLDADLSVYYNNWTRMQTTGYSNGTPLNYVTNSGRASGPGVNFALNASPISDLTASVTLGYADMKHDDKSAVTNPGDPVDLVAKWTYSAVLDYHRPLADGVRLISRLDYGYGSGYQITVRNTPSGIFSTPSRAVLDARLGVDLGRYQVYAFGHNLTDNNGQLFPGPLGTNPEAVLPTPRTIGLGGRVSF